MLTWSLVIVHLVCQGVAETPAKHPAPEALGAAFLSREVPGWSRENHCFSCHNNGDAARALFQAARRGVRVPEEALADTVLWLSKPAGWNHNGGDGAASDKKLGRVAFTVALSTAVSTGRVKDKSPLFEAATRLIGDQEPAGAWKIDGDDTVSSPATYGRALATLLARESLFAADPVRFRPSIDRADQWLAHFEVQTISDAAVALMASAAVPAGASVLRQEQCFNLLLRGQSDDGGWGPRSASPPETFDTALVVLALARRRKSPEAGDILARGRAFLIAQQKPDGSWTETTRPSGNVSYAQRISTSGWALLALLESQPPVESSGGDPKR
jgi:hypothetical protein